MICYVRTSTIQYDIRLRKYVSACIETGTPYIAITWDRLNNCSESYGKEFQYRRVTPYGRRWKNLFNKILWQFYVLKKLIAHVNNYKIIHVCDTESIIPAIFMKIFGKKIVLDIYDSAFPKFERFCAKHIVDLLILPTSKRLKQIGLTEDEPRRFLEVENVPTLNFETKEDTVADKQLIKLSYVGVFEKDIRGLENLINEVLENNKLHLDIAGTGAGLDNFVKEAANICDRINYHGVVDYQTGLSLMSQSDFIIAMYYNVISNHTYASPNKYYESLYLGVPIITTKHTLVGDNAETNQVGYAIGETQKDLHVFLEEANTIDRTEDYNLKKSNCISLWQRLYSQYFKNKLCCEYIKTLKELTNQ